MSSNEAKRPQGTEDWSEPEAQLVRRSDDRDIRFNGWKLGGGSEGTGGSSGYACDWNRGTRIRLYLTEAGAVIIGRYSWSHWQGESDHYSAEVILPSAELGSLVLAALRGEDGRLGEAAKEAWESACDKFAPLGAEQEEVVQ